MKKIIAMSIAALIIGVIACEKEDLPKYDHKDYSLIQVLKNDTLLFYIGAVPGDTITTGSYTIIVNKRK